MGMLENVMFSSILFSGNTILTDHDFIVVKLPW
jgi:hypothetical protein